MDIIRASEYYAEDDLTPVITQCVFDLDEGEFEYIFRQETDNNTVDDYFCHQALGSQDKRLCVSIEEEETKELCMIIVEGDADSCSDDYCMALATKDERYCENLPNFEDRSFCKADITTIDAINEDSIRLCDGIEIIESRYLCRNLISFDEQNENMFEREYCLDLFYLEKGEMNAYHCGKIQDLLLKNKCYDRVLIKIAKGNRDICPFVVTDFYQEDCPIKVDEYLKDNARSIIECEKIEDESIRTECMEWQSYKQMMINQAQLIEDCSFFKTVKISDQCNFNFGRNLKDETFCYGIKDKKLYYTCLGITTDNDDYCDLVEDEGYKEICLEDEDY
jgi:hypothetical protein